MSCAACLRQLTHVITEELAAGHRVLYRSEQKIKTDGETTQKYLEKIMGWAHGHEQLTLSLQTTLCKQASHENLGPRPQTLKRILEFFDIRETLYDGSVLWLRRSFSSLYASVPGGSDSVFWWKPRAILTAATAHPLLSPLAIHTRR